MFHSWAISTTGLCAKEAELVATRSQRSEDAALTLHPFSLKVSLSKDIS